MSEVTYLDHAATTPLRPEVAEAMAEVYRQPLGNPTGSHPPAQRARRLLEEARDEVAAFMGFEPADVIFTSGGTESANLAVFGSFGTTGEEVPLVLYSAVEHPAVIESCQAAVRAGLCVCEVIPVGEDGALDTNWLSDLLKTRAPRLVAVMAANNETGVLGRPAAIAFQVHRRHPDAVVFSDAVQAAGYLDLTDVTAGVDMVGLSAHKVGGPVGVGVLAVREGRSIAAHMFGGGQERKRRSGTQNVAGAVGLATALRLVRIERVVEVARVSELRDRLAKGLLAVMDGVHPTVHAPTEALPGHFHLCLEDIDREELLVALGQRGICVSGGSSCASGALQTSHVLEAMGVPTEWARGAIRFSLGRTSTEDDVDRILATLPDVVASLRQAV